MVRVTYPVEMTIYFKVSDKNSSNLPSSLFHINKNGTIYNTSISVQDPTSRKKHTVKSIFWSRSIKKKQGRNLRNESNTISCVVNGSKIGSDQIVDLAYQVALIILFFTFSRSFSLDTNTQRVLEDQLSYECLQPYNCPHLPN